MLARERLHIFLLPAQEQREEAQQEQGSAQVQQDGGEPRRAVGKGTETEHHGAAAVERQIPQISPHELEGDQGKQG